MDIASKVKSSASSGPHTIARLLEDTDSSAEDICRFSTRYMDTKLLPSDRNKDKAARQRNAAVTDSYLLLEGCNCAF